MGLTHEDSADHTDSFGKNRNLIENGLIEANKQFGWGLKPEQITDLSYVGMLQAQLKTPNEELKSYIMTKCNLTKLETDEQKATYRKELQKWDQDVKKLCHENN